MNPVFQDPEVAKALADLRAATEKATKKLGGGRIKTSMIYLEVIDKDGELQVGINADCCPCPQCAAGTVNEITDLFRQIVIRGIAEGDFDGTTKH